MKHLSLAAIMVAATGGHALACDDHHGTCEIEAWTWYQTSPYLSIEGVTTCDEGLAKIRLYDGEVFIGVVDGIIEGHALQAIHMSIPAKPKDLAIKYSISTR